MREQTHIRTGMKLNIRIFLEAFGGSGQWRRWQKTKGNKNSGIRPNFSESNLIHSLACTRILNELSHAECAVSLILGSKDDRSQTVICEILYFSMSWNTLHHFRCWFEVMSRIIGIYGKSIRNLETTYFSFRRSCRSKSARKLKSNALIISVDYAHTNVPK